MTTDRRLNFRPRETDLAAIRAIMASLADPARTVTETDAIRDAIHRHPAVCRPEPVVTFRASPIIDPNPSRRTRPAPKRRTAKERT